MWCEPPKGDVLRPTHTCRAVGANDLNSDDRATFPFTVIENVLRLDAAARHGTAARPPWAVIRRQIPFCLTPAPLSRDGAATQAGADAMQAPPGVASDQLDRVFARLADHGSARGRSFGWSNMS